MLFWNNTVWFTSCYTIWTIVVFLIDIFFRVKSWGLGATIISKGNNILFNIMIEIRALILLFYVIKLISRDKFSFVTNIMLLFFFDIPLIFISLKRSLILIHTIVFSASFLKSFHKTSLKCVHFRSVIWRYFMVVL